MARRNVDDLPLLLLLLLFITGCSAVKEVPKAVVLSEATPAALSLLPSMNRDVEYLSANVKMTATINGETAKAKGKLRLRKDEGVQIGATAMGLMEAACFEFLPEEVHFIYKIDKIYAASPYSEVPFFSNSGTGYKVLESLLTNRIFTGEGTPMDKEFAGASIDDKGDMVTVTLPLAASRYRYHIEKSSGNLLCCEGEYEGEGSFKCVYSDFGLLGDVAFPSRMELSFKGGGTTASLTLELRDIKEKEFKFTPRRLSSSYEKVSLQWVVNSVGENLE